MKKFLIYLICFVAGALICAAGLYLWLRSMSGSELEGFLLKSSAATENADIGEDATNAELIAYAYDVLAIIKGKDYEALAEVSHPESGILFSPYGTVAPGTDKCFMPAEVEKFGSDKTTYIWGVYDGSAEPIELPVKDYFEKFVFDTDFTITQELCVDGTVRAGNTVDNTTQIFKDARYIEFYHGDQNSASNLASWSALRLVFQEYKGTLRLVAIIHNQQTV